MMQLQKVELISKLTVPNTRLSFTISRYAVGHRSYDPEFTRGELGLCESVHLPVGYTTRLVQFGPPVKPPRDHAGGWIWRRAGEVGAWDGLMVSKDLITEAFFQSMLDHEVADLSGIMNNGLKMDEIRSHLERKALRREAVENGAAPSLLDGIL